VFPIAKRLQDSARGGGLAESWVYVSTRVALIRRYIGAPTVENARSAGLELLKERKIGATIFTENRTCRGSVVNLPLLQSVVLNVPISQGSAKPPPRLRKAYVAATRRGMCLKPNRARRSLRRPLGRVLVRLRRSSVHRNHLPALRSRSDTPYHAIRPLRSDTPHPMRAFEIGTGLHGERCVGG
jgi:hypothetical protein